MLEIFVDADASPVKDEVLKVVHRHGLIVHFVSNQWLRLEKHPNVRLIVVAEGLDVADDWIAEHISPGDIAITADIPLADRCVKAGGRVLGPSGKPFTEDSIGMALSMRNLMSDLREAGEVKTYNASFSKKDRSRFLQALETIIQDLKKNQNPGT